ncbi:unnamed protein product [Nippostrongylus brasiliensis]|uniref:CCHC-type domain-containing protein n=1 Tax=Nippostrongylus brasiliensis TaxID=27835 RepID=A0A158QXS7_NIPBR|nr:unnamed protein product [Nippostrongylus brasiliensis]
MVFIGGLQSVETRKRLLKRGELTSKEALEQAEAYERVGINAPHLKEGPQAVGVAQVSQLKGNRVRQQRRTGPPQERKGKKSGKGPARDKLNCRVCGRPGHFGYECLKRSSAYCNVCKKKGHFPAVCWKKGSPKSSRQVHWCEEPAGSSDSEEDTVTFGNHTATMEFHLFKGATHSLCGRDMIRELQINCGPHYEKVDKVEVWSRVEIKREILRLLEKSRSLFQGGLGRCTTAQAKLKFKDDKIVPKFFRARPVPIALRPKVEAKLEELVKNGTLKRVEHSQWATPLVVVPKPGGRIRICGDYKVTVNPQLDINQYPLPKPVANNFGYRYLLLCRRPHIYIYQTTRGRLLLTCVNTFVTVFWTYFAVVMMRSDAKLTAVLESFIRAEMELDIWDHGHTALALEVRIQHYRKNTTERRTDLQDLISSPVKLVVCSGILMTYMMLMISIGYCTNRILHMLKNSAMSIALKRLHRQMLVLLLLQLLNPLISMYGPVIIFVIFLVNNFTTPVALSAVMCALYSTFPLVNPIVMLYFVTDYRAFIVKRLTRTKSDNVWSNSWNMKASDNKARPAFS